MTAQKLTPIHAKHLTALVESLRPDWGRSGVADAIWRARGKGDAIAVCVAAIKATAPTNRTPAVIALDGTHWHDAAKPATTSQGSAVGRCVACGGMHSALAPCDPPEQARSHGRGAQLARQALVDARKEATDG
jgi:hypothetical protein